MIISNKFSKRYHNLFKCLLVKIPFKPWLVSAVYLVANTEIFSFCGTKKEIEEHDCSSEDPVTCQTCFHPTVILTYDVYLKDYVFTDDI